MLLTEEFIRQNSTAAGGWTKDQLAAMGIVWPPEKGWIDRSIGRHLTPDEVAAIREHAGLTPDQVRQCRKMARNA